MATIGWTNEAIAAAIGATNVRVAVERVAGERRSLKMRVVGSLTRLSHPEVGNPAHTHLSGLMLATPEADAYLVAGWPYPNEGVGPTDGNGAPSGTFICLETLCGFWVEDGEVPEPTFMESDDFARWVAQLKGRNLLAAEAAERHRFRTMRVSLQDGVWRRQGLGLTEYYDDITDARHVLHDETQSAWRRAMARWDMDEHV